MSGNDRERGQALPLLLLAVLLAGGTMLVLTRLGAVATHDARARTAADATALAAAAEGPAAAERVATANGGRVLTVEELGADVRVEVAVGERTATAQARAEQPPPMAGAPTTGLVPEMIAAIRRAEALLGRPIPITSGWRSRADQERLWEHRATNPYPVARPGTSNHERGIAIDVPRWFVPQLRGVAAAAGLCFPLPASDPIHFELCR
jgi:hypothetical protein